MKRRDFVLGSSILCLGITSLSSKEISKNDNALSWLIIDKVFDILFPKTKNMPSAKEFAATSYLKINSTHKTFNKDDILYILEGAQDFNSAFSTFLQENIEEQTNIISRVNGSEHGQEWLTKLVYYGIEAMLSDPIYGGNKNEIAWKSLQHETGRPQPKVKYAKVI